MFKKIVLKEGSILKKLDKPKFRFSIFQRMFGNFRISIEWKNENGNMETKDFEAGTFLELLNKFNDWEMPDCLK